MRTGTTLSHFPMDPTVGIATLSRRRRSIISGTRVLSEAGNRAFKVTVVEMPGEDPGPNAAVMKVATKAVA